MNSAKITENFVEYCKNERQLSPNTLLAYRQDIAEFDRFFLTLNVGNITGSDLVSYCQYLGSVRKLAPATIKRRLACIRAMFVRLTRQGVIKSNPFSTVDLRVRRPTRLPRSLGAGEMRQLMREAEQVGDREHLAILLLFATGVRIGELAGIRVADIDLEHRSIRIFGKGSRERQVFLPDDALDAVGKHLASAQGAAAPSTHLLKTRGGLAATSAYLRRQVGKLAEKAGLTRRVTPHMIRHTTATALIEGGVDIRFVQRLLGHQSIVTTQLYTHVSDRALKKVIIGADICRNLTAHPSSVA